MRLIPAALLTIETGLLRWLTAVSRVGICPVCAVGISEICLGWHHSYSEHRVDRRLRPGSVMVAL